MIYEYRCKSCSEITEAVRSIADRDLPLDCEKCGARTRKIITTRYSVQSDLAPYYDDNLQTHISSHKQRRKVMKEQGVSEYYGKGWT